ncbi:hypothetical protein [Streptomyces sp. NBC_01530]|uniref:hypothetical protein n=1 Tax=Streptomyces sp. NBC_01530 TaxID=2903895 RepID=UPI00386DAC0F
MNRTKHLDLADAAVRRAENLAGDIERAAAGGDSQGKVPRLAAAGALWADVARAHAAIAAATPETTPETADA